MKQIDILKGIVDGSVSVDCGDHNQHSVSNTIGYFRYKIKEYLDYFYYSYDTPDIFFENNIDIGAKIILVAPLYINCQDCGEELCFIYSGDKKVTVLTRQEYYANNSITNTISCKCHSKTDGTKIVTEINVPSGKLVFSNYFNELVDMYGKTSINYLLGRIELANLYSEKNIGYGQMGNMSICIYKNIDGTEIIIGDEYYIDKESGEEEEVFFEGFTKIGKISLSMWRWMCGDIESLKNAGVETLSFQKEETESNSYYTDIVLLDVERGTWVIEHYYGLDGDNNVVYSRLFLKK